MFPQEISIFLPIPDNHMQNSVFCTDMLFNDKRERGRGDQVIATANSTDTRITFASSRDLLREN